METKGGFYISKIKQIQDRIFYKLLDGADIDISSGQGRILYILWQESPLTISEIGKRASLAKTTMTAMLDGMEAKDFVIRNFDKSNRREIKISLTQKAIAMKEQYAEVSDKMTKIFYQGFSDKDIIDFEQKLLRITNNLQTEEQNIK